MRGIGVVRRLGLLKRLSSRLCQSGRSALSGEPPRQSGTELTEYEKRMNCDCLRARGEHPGRVVEQLWGFTKERYRDLAANPARAQLAFDLANLEPQRRELMPS